MSIASVLNGFRLFAGEKLNEIITAVNTLTANGANGGATAGAGSFTALTQNGALTELPQTVVAAGSNSQTNATAITNSLVIVATVSATTRAVKLPAAATGRKVEIRNAAGTAVKVYPATGDKIGAAATNAVGAAIATLKGNIYAAKDAVTWLVLTGA